MFSRRPDCSSGLPESSPVFDTYRNSGVNVRPLCRGFKVAREPLIFRHSSIQIQTDLGRGFYARKDISMKKKDEKNGMKENGTKELHGPASGHQALSIPWEDHRITNVLQFEHGHNQPGEAQPPASMRRHAVAEGHEVELEAVRIQPFSFYALY